MNHCWMSAIARSENSVEKMQVFWPWSSLRMSACTVPRTVETVRARITSSSAASGSRPASARKCSTCWSIAALKNIARIVGAGPLMVIETDVVGEQRSNPAYRSFMSSSVAIETPEVPTLP